MGVYIKGMEVPKDCRSCSFQDYSFTTGETWCGVNNIVLAKNFEAIGFDGRPEWCPLVDLGKHGDLIDRDEVRNAVFHHLSIKGEENLLPAEKSVFGNIIKAEAVIEAEGE